MIYWMFGGLILLAWRNAAKKGNLTPEREEIYLSALEHADAQSLRKLADAFEGEGLNVHAFTLRKRAELRELPRETKQVHRAIRDKALQSTNPEAVLAVAREFRRITANGSANMLEEHARTLLMQRAQGFAQQWQKEKSPAGRLDEKGGEPMTPSQERPSPVVAKDSPPVELKFEETEEEPAAEHQNGAAKKVMTVTP